MSIWTLVAFSAVAFIAIATPGPTVLLALANGSRFGFRRSAWGMAGAATSDFVLVGAAAVGLGALLAASEFWFGVVKWIGVAYLAWLGIQMLRSRGSLDPGALAAAGQTRGSPRALFTKSFLVAVTNPKGYLFVSAFMPQFVSASGPQLTQYAVLAVLFAAIDVAVMAIYAGFGARAVRVLARGGLVWLDRACGGALLTLAGSLAFYRRAA